jgi:hypothetical protein
MATDTSLFLIGDSNIIAIARAARDQSRVFRGGPVGIGLDLERPFFTVENGDFVLLGTHLDSIRDEFRDLLRHSGPILSTVGFNSHRFAQRLHNFIKLKGGSSWQDLMSQQVFHQTVLDARREALSTNFFRNTIVKSISYIRPCAALRNIFLRNAALKPLLSHV